MRTLFFIFLLMLSKHWQLENIIPTNITTVIFYCVVILDLFGVKI